MYQELFCRRYVRLANEKLPWWVLVGTGAYLLFQVGWGLFTFNDTPKAHEELLMVCDAC